MKIFDKIEINPKELWYILFLPLLFFGNFLRKLKRTRKYNFREKDNNILWQYRVPLFKRRKNLSKEDIIEVKPLCRECKCELRNDFNYLIDKRADDYQCYFTCPNCRLVHHIITKSLDGFYCDLKRRLALIENKK